MHSRERIFFDDARLADMAGVEWERLGQSPDTFPAVFEAVRESLTQKALKVEYRFTVSHGSRTRGLSKHERADAIRDFARLVHVELRNHIPTE